VLIGEAGVGKSAVVEGLAQRIAAHQVSSSLLDVHILSLSPGIDRFSRKSFEAQLYGADLSDLNLRRIAPNMHNAEHAQHHEVTLARQILPAAHFEGRCRISARACNRFASTALLLVPALFLSDRLKLWSLASSRGFRCEPSALSIAFRTATIWAAGSACDRSN
jgi:hypothetical protein